MPPTHKFTKEDIIAAALNVVKKEGIEGLTARRLGAEIGTSSRPIFTAFKNMEDLQKETLQAAKAIYDSYSEEGLTQNPPFRGIGTQYFRFSKEEPRLFEILFMKKNVVDVGISDTLIITHGNHEGILGVIQDSYGLSVEESNKMFQTMWLFVHGIACLQVTGMINFTEAEVSEMLIEVFSGVLLKLKNISNAQESLMEG